MADLREPVQWIGNPHSQLIAASACQTTYPIITAQQDVGVQSFRGRNVNGVGTLKPQ